MSVVLPITVPHEGLVARAAAPSAATTAATIVLGAEAVAARRWLMLAVGALILAGSLALLLVIGRMPPFDRLVPDPLFFRRCLVVHVNLSLVVWLYAMIAGLLFLLPARGASAPWTRAGAGVAAAGTAALLLAPIVTRGEAVLSNYVPVIDHPLFIGGLIAIGAGIVLSFLDGRLMPATDDRLASPTAVELPLAARSGLRAAGVALLVAAVTFYASVIARPQGVEAPVYYELLLWGGGHVLQVASVAGMLAVWIMLLGSLLGRSPIGTGASRLLFGALLTPWLAAPLIAIAGSQEAWVHQTFTALMRWSIFPVVLACLALCARALVVARREGRLALRPLDVRLTAFLVSAALTILGFVLGALIRGSNTMVPAHYHASVGGVTASFMGAAIFLAAPLGLPIPTPRLARLAALQPLVFGTGQMVFATGFAIAGAHGMARKAYGAEQAGRTLPETIGLGVMGAGGLVAVVGGLLFLWIAVAAWRASRATVNVSTTSPSGGLAHE